MLLFLAWWVMCGVYIFFSVISSYDIMHELAEDGVELPLWTKKGIMLSIYLLFGPVFLTKRVCARILSIFQDEHID